MDKLRAAVAGATGWAARSRPVRSLRAVLPGSDDDQRGQGLAEYSLILGLIAIVAIVSLVFLGESINQLFDDIINEGFRFVETVIEGL